MRYSTTTTASSSLLLLASTALAANSTLAGLNDLAKAAGKKYFGTSTDNNEITDQTYFSALQNPSMWGALTPGNSQKWQFTEKQPGQFSFDDGDAIVKIAQDNNMLVRCHTLVWYSQLPSWVTSGTWTNETLSAVMKTHIENEVNHFKGKCYAWDVVNEALEEDGTFRKNVFLENIGESYIPTAFGIAAAADPDAKLYYNDYNIETTGKKQAAAVNIVKAVKAAGQKIDGVGLQAHLTVGQVAPQSSYASVLKSFIDAGVTEVAYTELDIRFSSLPSTDSGLKTQGDNYAAVVSACLDTKECVGVTIWDFSDKYSWVPSTFPGNGDALIFDKNFEPKPAYFSISSVLAAAATGAPVSTGTETTVKVSATVTASASVSASTSATKDSASPTSTAAASSKSAASKTTLATVVKATDSASTTTSAPASSTTDDEFCDVEDDGDDELVATSSASSAASTATGTMGAKAAQYQQCGGNGFTGPTECVDGFTCKVQNPYYSQCL